jgi:plasmid stabilization system protein ParE
VTLVDALAFVRRRLLAALTEIEREDPAAAAREIGAAASELRAAVDAAKDGPEGIAA